jgi:hypothetical protein
LKGKTILGRDLASRFSFSIVADSVHDIIHCLVHSRRRRLDDASGYRDVVHKLWRSAGAEEECRVQPMFNFVCPHQALADGTSEGRESIRPGVAGVLLTRVADKSPPSLMWVVLLTRRLIAIHFLTKKRGIF